MALWFVVLTGQHRGIGFREFSMQYCLWLGDWGIALHDSLHLRCQPPVIFPTATSTT